MVLAVSGTTMEVCAWDGNQWSTIATGGPPPRYGFSLAFDRARGELVLFGGSDGTSLNGDTWVRRAAGWIRRNPTTRPPAAPVATPRR